MSLASVCRLVLLFVLTVAASGVAAQKAEHLIATRDHQAAVIAERPTNNPSSSLTYDDSATLASDPTRAAQDN